MPFAVAVLSDTALILTVLGVLLGACALLSRQIDRLGIPVVLLFLVLGMLGGSEGLGGIAFENYDFAVKVGTAYLALIIFDGGMNTAPAAARRVILPAGILATFGVALTAGFLAAFAHLLGLPWTEALLIGSVVSSTDAAAVLAVLRGGGLHLRPKVGTTLEVESCVNDPMALILTLAMIQVALAPDVPWVRLAIDVPVQLAVGALVGAAIGGLGRLLLTRVPPAASGLYPVLTLGLAFFSFGLATYLGGSGLLSVFVTGLVLGSGHLPYRASLDHVHTALAWLSQVGLFLMLGLLVFPSHLPAVAGTGLAVALFLAFVARPLAVALCLAPLRWPARDVLYVGWIGLRGAVPIILGVLPLLAGVPGAERIFNIVFFIVVISALLPGATIRPVSRWLRQASPQAPRPSAVLEINTAHPLTREIASFRIEPEAAVCSATLADLSLPPDAAVMLVVRGPDLLPARGPTQLLPGDHAYVFFRPEDRPAVVLLFGPPERA